MASPVTIPVPLPPGLLELGDNTLHLTLPGDTGAAGDNIYIDWIELGTKACWT